VVCNVVVAGSTPGREVHGSGQVVLTHKQYNLVPAKGRRRSGDWEGNYRPGGK